MKTKRISQTLLASAVLLAFAGQSQATLLSFPDFSSTSGLTLPGRCPKRPHPSPVRALHSSRATTALMQHSVGGARRIFTCHAPLNLLGIKNLKIDRRQQ